MHRILIPLILLFLFTSCQTPSTRAEPSKPICKLSDTIFKQLTFGMTGKNFYSKIKDDKFNFINVNSGKLQVQYKPEFYNNALFRLEVSLFQPLPPKDSNTNYSNGNILQDIIKSSLNYHRVIINQYQYRENEMFETLIKQFKNKYGVPETRRHEGEVGNWNDENGYRWWDFNIKQIYVWQCDDKYISLEYDVDAFVNSATRGEKPDAELVLHDSTFKVISYNNFKITYVEKKNEQKKAQQFQDRSLEDKRINDSIQRIKNEKLKKDI